MAKYWTCPSCATRNERIKRKCAGENCSRSRPKKRVAKHATTLRDDSYPVFEALNELVHGPAFPGDWARDHCGVCGKPPSQERHHDRDHGHLRGSLTYGKPRGLACGGNSGCNILMLPWVTAETAQGIAQAKLEAGEADAERWVAIAAYLRRCDAHYAPGVTTGTLVA